MIVAIALLGAVLGSFLAVVAHRVPRGLSLVRPGSRCPACAHPIRPWHNVPVLGWALLRGRCRDCAAPISVRYPLVELATALLFAAAAVRIGPEPHLLPALVLIAFLVPISLVDLDERIIPNRLTAPAAAAAVALTLAIEPGALPERLAAAAAGGGAFLAIALLSGGGMGMGDVKLVAVLGLYLGVALAPAVLVALAAGSLAGLAVVARRGVSAGRRTAVPFGPFLALGGVVGLLAGGDLLGLYLDAAR